MRAHCNYLCSGACQATPWPACCSSGCACNLVRLSAPVRSMSEEARGAASGRRCGWPACASRSAACMQVRADLGAWQYGCTNKQLTTAIACSIFGASSGAGAGAYSVRAYETPDHRASTRHVEKSFVMTGLLPLKGNPAPLMLCGLLSRL